MIELCVGKKLDRFYLLIGLCRLEKSESNLINVNDGSRWEWQPLRNMCLRVSKMAIK